MSELRTPRLVLRQWRDDDLPVFATLNADPEVMEHFPSVLSRAESDAVALGLRTHIATLGWGLWAIEVVDTAPFVGFVGLWRPRFEAHFTPAVEIGWRLAREHWGCGYATEGAQAAISHAFGELDLAEIVSFTTVANERSRRVMERLGMTHDPADDFDHPSLPHGHPQRRHVLYRLRRD